MGLLGMRSGSSVNKERFFSIINKTWLACAFWSAKVEEEIVGRVAESSHWPFSKIVKYLHPGIPVTLSLSLPGLPWGCFPAPQFKTAQQLWH